MSAAGEIGSRTGDGFDLGRARVHAGKRLCTEVCRACCSTISHQAKTSSTKIADLTLLHPRALSGFLFSCSALISFFEQEVWCTLPPAASQRTCHLRARDYRHPL